MFKMLSRGKDYIRKKWDLNETSRDCNFWYEKYTGWHFPGGSVVKSLHFHCRGCRFYHTCLATHLPPQKNKLDKINGRLDIVEERLVQVLVIEAIQNETKKIFLMKRAAVIYGTTSSNLINIGMLESPKERAGGEYGGNT